MDRTMLNNVIELNFNNLFDNEEQLFKGRN